MDFRSAIVRKDSHHLVLAVLVIGTIGVLLALQGWNSRSMLFDNLNFIDAADQLLKSGTLPDRGDVSSYWVYATPGPAWFMVPGMLIFSDPRLYEVIGSVFLYAGTLAGIFLIARMCFGVRCAYLSVALFGLSRIGIFYAATLWSIGHPFFYIWAAYFCIRWIRERNSNYLAAALSIWSIGMYVDMVLAPAAFMFPALWLIYRPRLKLAPLAVAAAITAVTWFPYLRLQVNRDFVDLKSLVMRQHDRPVDFKKAWCQPALTAHALSGDNDSAGAESLLTINDSAASLPEQVTWYDGVKSRIRGVYGKLSESLPYNFDQPSKIPGSAWILLMLLLATLLYVAIRELFSITFVARLDSPYWIGALAWMAIVLSVLINEYTVAHILSANGTLASLTVLHVRIAQAAFFLGGLFLIWSRSKVPGFLERLAVDRSAGNGNEQRAGNQALFAILMTVPWLVMLMIAEHGTDNRFWWLWSVQVIPIAAAVTYIPERLGWPRITAWLASIAVLTMLLTYPELGLRLQAWSGSGWSGPRANDVEALDYVADQMKVDGKKTTAIGYQIFFQNYMAVSHVVDPRYKVGGELDLFLRDRFGITNLDKCAEGVSSEDEYRIVQLTPRLTQTRSFLQSLDIPLDPRYRPIQQFGPYQVLKIER
jgi:hypothetical protein